VALPSAAGSGVAAAFGADAVNICVDASGGRVNRVMIAELRDGDTVDNDEARATDGEPSLKHVVAGERYSATVEVRSGPLATRPLKDATDVTVDGRRGQLGRDADSGDRTLVFDSGIGGAVVSVGFGSHAPSRDKVLEWAKGFAVSTNPSDCGY
jgi:hypothetical protein